MQQNQQMMYPGVNGPERPQTVEPYDETRYTQSPEGQGAPGWGQSMQNGMPPGGKGGQQGGMSSQHAQSQRMRNPVSMADTHTPADNSQAYQASLRSLLSRNIGYYIICTFLVGNQQHVSWQGILHTVGSDYLVLYQPDFERYVSCDLYSLKFVQFHDSRTAPYCSDFQSMQGQTVW